MNFKMIAVAVLAVGSVLAPVANAAQVVFSNPTWRLQTYGGGEFGADLLGVGGSVDFYTFCLEKNEGMGFGTPYDYTLATAAMAGGLGGGNPDPISAGTSFLYQQFLNQTLPGYNFATSTAAERAARAASGRDLQNAIWGLEDEQLVNLANPFIVQVVNAFGSIAAAKAHATSGAIGVLNPTNPALSPTSPLYRRQSVLINLPDNGTAAMMLGGSLMLIGAVRRRTA
ncbi:MAG: hypothetical protein AB7O66_17995 [Limisphaerales bacterium]